MNVVHEKQPAREYELGAIILAGGEGLRLRARLRDGLPDGILPNNFCPLFGTAILLRPDTRSSFADVP